MSKKDKMHRIVCKTLVRKFMIFFCFLRLPCGTNMLLTIVSAFKTATVVWMSASTYSKFYFMFLKAPKLPWSMTEPGGDRVEDRTTTKSTEPSTKTSEKPTEKRSFTGRKLPQFEEPGLRNVRSTNIFRAVNFELYVKPVRTGSHWKIAKATSLTNMFINSM